MLLYVSTPLTEMAARLSSEESALGLRGCTRGDAPVNHTVSGG